MRQFTMNIEDGLLLATKQHALRTGITMSELVRDLLAREVGWSPVNARETVDDALALPVLRAYSEGTMSRRHAMQALDLEPEQFAQFVDAMNRLSVPWPRLDPEQVDREAEIVAQAIKDADDAN